MFKAKMQVAVLGCLSMTALTSVFNVPNAQASAVDNISIHGIQSAQRIDRRDRFEYRDREEYFDEYNQDNRFEDNYNNNYDQERSRRRRRLCWRLQRSINYMTQIREELRNDGDYSRARELAREIRQQRNRYNQYCQ